ncbi:SRPBCC family protein [Streptomyces sp. NPDC046985]|uniref:SRPBCC family protein n=1 Tax=Streptomyces sp. NPDC046985 TaxID=3155377 RepID=UPI0033F42AD3
MAKPDTTTTQDGASGLDRLRAELVSFLGAQAGHLASLAGDKVEGLTGQLIDVAENDGMLGKVGARVLKGESPVKALIGTKTKDIKDSVVDKAKSLFGGKGRKSGQSKVINIIEHLDVGVPLRVAYDHWTQYAKFSSFTKGVRSVSQENETNSDWKLKVGPSSRSWKATVQEQVPDERIMWTSEGAKGTTRGCISFHEVTPTLTHIAIVVEYYPSGFFEKTGNIWRAQGRRLRLDAKNFQRYVTLSDEAPEGWRGEIRDGEVVRSHEEALEEEENEREREGEGEGEETEGPENEEEFEDEEEPEGEEEEDEGDEGDEDREDDEEYEDYGDYEDEDEDEEEPEHEREYEGSGAGRRR